MRVFLIIFWGLLFGLGHGLPLKAQTVDFFKEDLDFYLNRDYFVVQGVYFFANPSNVDFKGWLWYPFPDSNVTDIKVFDQTFKKLNCSLIKQNTWGVEIPLRITAGDTAFFIVRYNQTFTDGRVCYIVTSTQHWKRPLKEANFRLTLDSFIKNAGFSFKPQRKKKLNGKKFYYWQFTDFYPGKDFWIYFK